jgi:hypothetical protein
MSDFDFDFQQALFGGEMVLESGRNGPFIWTREAGFLVCPRCRAVYDMSRFRQLKVGSRCQTFVKKSKARNANEFADTKDLPDKALCTGVLERVGKVAEKIPLNEITQALAFQNGDESERGESLNFKWFTEKGAHIRRKKIEELLDSKKSTGNDDSE